MTVKHKIVYRHPIQTILVLYSITVIQHYHLLYFHVMKYFFSFLLLPCTPRYPHTSLIGKLNYFTFHTYLKDVFSFRMLLKEMKLVVVLKIKLKNCTIWQYCAFCWLLQYKFSLRVFK